MTLNDILSKTTAILRDNGIESPRLNARLLIAKATNCNPTRLHTGGNQIVTNKSRTAIERMVNERLKRTPVQYILGHAEFMSLDFIVDNSVLIPRPESELVVESVLKMAEETRRPQCRRKAACQPAGQIDVIDLCAGSGNIAISIAAYLKNTTVYGSDNSRAALTVAEKNAKRLNVEDRVRFLHGDMFDAFRVNYTGLKADFIVSNPPYIAESEWNALPPEVARHEPRQALIGGKDGLDFYRVIVSDAARWLKDDGYLIMEIGEGQMHGVKELISARGTTKRDDHSRLTFISGVKDLQGIERVVIARKSA